MLPRIAALAVQIVRSEVMEHWKDAMKAYYLKGARLAALAMIAAMALPVSLAGAHGFNVALVVPLSGPLATEGSQIRDGFMLATKERDSHANEESDGHLGGLDVYVRLIDDQKMNPAEIKAVTERQMTDIVAAIGSPESVAAAESLNLDAQIVVLTPGETPFPISSQSASNDQSAAVASFIDSFQKEYGYAPAQSAAQGYNAARRIEVAVRDQGSVDNKEALQQHLLQTARGFNW